MSSAESSENKALCIIWLALSFAATIGSALAGDPIGVNRTFDSFAGNWPDAYFSVDPIGLSNDGGIVEGQSLRIQSLAQETGYLSYINVSPHGEIEVHRIRDKKSPSPVEFSVPTAHTTGEEQLLVLYSSASLTELFSGDIDGLRIGADVPSAEKLSRVLRALQQSGTRIAVRQIRYTVMPEPGNIPEVPSRSIVVKVLTNEQRDYAAHIQFNLDSDQLTQRGQRDLDQYGEALRHLKGKRLRLEGHTDETGPDEHNMTLSWRRAASAKRYLEENYGLPDNLLEIDGKGKAGALNGNRTEQEREQNRRVDIQFRD